MGVRNFVGVSDADAVALVRTAFRVARAENVPFMAASLAYHAFVSLIPLLLFALFVLSIVGSETLTASIVSLTHSLLAPHTQGLVVAALGDVPTRSGAPIFGALALLWGTFKIFRGLDVAFARIYDTPTDDSLHSQLADGLVVAAALALAVAVVVTVGVVFVLFPGIPFAKLLSPLLLVAGLAVAFFPIYYVFPNVDLTPREVLPGLVVAALGWAVLQGLFQAYVSYAGRFEGYGAIGGVLVLVVWLYVSGLVLLLGAVINAALAGRTGDERAGDRTQRATRDESRGSPRASREATDLDRERLARAYEELGRAYERLDADNRRLKTERDRLDAENERLKRENADLTRQLQRRRRPVWTRAKRWMFGE